MINGVLKKVFGTKQDRDIKAMTPILKQINLYADQMKQLSDEQLQAQTPKFREMLNNGATLRDILPEVNYPDWLVK